MDLEPTPSASSSVTVVIPAHDAARTLAAALRSVGHVGSTIVVDDGSTDDTAAIAEEHGAQLIRHRTPRGPAAARNAGIRGAGTELVLLLDADAVVDTDVLDLLLAHLTDPTVGGVAPRIRTRGDSTALGRYEVAAGPLDLGSRGGRVRPDGPVPFVSTTALLLRREAWDAVGGFSEDLRFGEDLDLAWRLAAIGRPLVYEPAATVWHGHRTELRDHLVNRFRYGAAAGPLARRHRHPRPAVAPPLLAAAGTVGVLGARRTALALAVASVAMDAARLRPEAGARALRRAVTEHARAERNLAAAVSRPWLPIAVVVAAAVPRSRAPIAAAVVGRSIVAWRRLRPALPLPLWLALRVLDDLAFSLGVTHGCAVARIALPLLPATPADRA